MHTDPHDDGRKPLMQIGALLLTLAMVIGTIASGIALAAASLPTEFERFAQAVAFVGPLGAALTIGLTAIGKGLYNIGKGAAAAAFVPEILTDDDVIPEPVDGFAQASEDHPSPSQVDAVARIEADEMEG